MTVAACAAGAAPAEKASPGYDKAIAEYVRFLETQKQTPIDYITGRTGSAEELTKEVQQWMAPVRVSGYENKEIFPKNDCPEKMQQWLK